MYVHSVLKYISAGGYVDPPADMYFITECTYMPQSLRARRIYLGVERWNRLLGYRNPYRQQARGRQ